MGDEIELRHLRYFLAVAETLHFGRAAVKLGMAQPPLSQQIRRLETLLGHSLFTRTTRGVQLTPAGALLVDRARMTLGKMREDVEQVRRLGRGEEGSLSVGFSGSVMLTNLPQVIGAFRRRYPQVDLRLEESYTSFQQSALLQGRLDVGLLRDAEAVEGLKQTTVLREQFYAVLPKGHAAARAKKINVGALRDENFVLFARRFGPLAFDRTMACCEEAGFRPRVVQEAPQWMTVVRLVEAGIGVSLAPACVAMLPLHGVAFRAVESEAFTSIEVVMREGAVSAAAENFAAMAKAELRP